LKLIFNQQFKKIDQCLNNKKNRVNISLELFGIERRLEEFKEDRRHNVRKVITIKKGHNSFFVDIKEDK